jgi:hypothetical protein
MTACCLIARAIYKIVCRVLHIQTDVDRYKLLRGSQRVRDSELHWYLNFALLQDAARATNNPQIQRTIRFLEANYLKKVASPFINYISLFNNSVRKRFQVSPLPDTLYHRTDFKSKLKIGTESFNRRLALPKDSPLILTDTSEFAHLFPLSFTVVTPTEDSAERMINTIESHIRSHNSPKNSLSTPLTAGFLFDVTEYFGPTIYTNGNKIRETEFRQRYRDLEHRAQLLTEHIAAKLAQKYPSLSKQKIHSYIQKNITCVCRVDVDTIGGLKVLPLFTSLKGHGLEQHHPALVEFVGETGLYINAVTFRKLAFEKQLADINVRYAPTSRTPQRTSVRYFPKKDGLLTTNLFSKLSETCAPERTKGKEYLSILGNSTLKLLRGLIGEISEAQWEALHKDGATAQIIQASLYKIANHLASALLYRDSFEKFSVEIELIHAEIATLLELTSPFAETDFATIYQQALEETIPPELREYMRPSLGKTSVNVFAGINAALLATTENPVRTYSEGFYFEQASLVHDENKFERVLNDPTISKVDLYCGQFNPNVEIESSFTHYRQRDIAHDVRQLLTQKPAIEHLTVAIDCTTDYINSPKVRQLLEEFKVEILTGKLNFAFFKSGQKFDMFGMDNYFGAPFYMINNGSAHWKAMNALCNRQVHKTDRLSRQWFCLANKYAVHELDAYRKAIFANTRFLLEHIPPALLPQPSGKKQHLRINTIDANMEPSFIDMKVATPSHLLQRFLLIGLLYQKCEQRKIKIHSRASFGFYHINCIPIIVNAVTSSSTIRINPSLNPHDNTALIEFFQDASLQAK